MVKHYPLFINGERLKTERRETIRNPYNDQPVGFVSIGGEKEFEFAVTSAQCAFEVNRKLSSHRRSKVLLGVVAGLLQKREWFANLITRESGKPISLSYIEVDRAITTFTLAAEECKRWGGRMLTVDFQTNTEGFICREERFPVGPIAAITPFNFPLNLAAHKLAPAMAVGSSVVLKPPAQCPLSCLCLAELIHQAGAEPGTVNVIHFHPPLAERLATDERFKHLSITASDRLGWRLKALAGKKPVTLELGGNAGTIVHEDADLDWAATRIAYGAYIQAGQVCISVQRIFAHKPIYTQFKKKLLVAIDKLKTGDPMDPQTVVGPCITEAEAQRVVEWIKEAEAAGAKLLCGAAKRKGAVIKPVLLEGVDRASRLFCQEAFGPVATLESYSLFDTAIHAVNDSRFGLQAGVFTHDNRRIERAFRELEVGGVVVNDIPTVRVDNYPYGGIRDSGLGREGVRYTMESFTEPRVLVTNLNH